MLFFTNHFNTDPEITFEGEVITPAHTFRYLEVQTSSNLTLWDLLNTVSSKMATAIRSLYPARNQIFKKKELIFSIIPYLSSFFE